MNITSISKAITTFLCKYGMHRYTKAAAGYPPGSNYWIWVKACPSCGRNHRTIDDLFADPRPANYPIDTNFMETEPGFRQVIDVNRTPAGRIKGAYVYLISDFPDTPAVNARLIANKLIPVTFGTKL